MARTPDFIKFSPVQKRLVQEIQRDCQRNLNAVLDMIYTEMGIIEEVQASPDIWELDQEFRGIWKKEVKKENE